MTKGRNLTVNVLKFSLSQIGEIKNTTTENLQKNINIRFTKELQMIIKTIS